MAASAASLVNTASERNVAAIWIRCGLLASGLIRARERAAASTPSGKTPLRCFWLHAAMTYNAVASTSRDSCVCCTASNNGSGSSPVMCHAIHPMNSQFGISIAPRGRCRTDTVRPVTSAAITT